MQLYQRVKYIAEKFAESQTALAKGLGLAQSKFHHYLDEASEKNLWQYLPKILELYPQISRDWLYFGEGEPEDVHIGISKQQCGEINKENQSLKEENLRLYREISKLSQEILVLNEELRKSSQTDCRELGKSEIALGVPAHGR